MGIFNPKKVKYVKICPKCKSIKIKTELRSGWFIGLPASYKCQECGHKSKFFPEIEIDLEKLSKKKGYLARRQAIQK